MTLKDHQRYRRFISNALSWVQYQRDVAHYAAAIAPYAEALGIEIPPLETPWREWKRLIREQLSA